MSARRKRKSVVNDSIPLPMRTIKVVTTVVVCISLVVGSAFGIDARYASAGSVRQLSAKIDYNSLNNRKAYIEDKLFDLQQIPSSKRDSKQDAQIERYLRLLDEVNRDIDKAKERMK